MASTKDWRHSLARKVSSHTASTTAKSALPISPPGTTSGRFDQGQQPTMGRSVGSHPGRQGRIGGGQPGIENHPDLVGAFSGPGQDVGQDGIARDQKRDG